MWGGWGCLKNNVKWIHRYLLMDAVPSREDGVSLHPSADAHTERRVLRSYILHQIWCDGLLGVKSS